MEIGCVFAIDGASPALFVDPHLEVIPRDTPLPPELHGGQLTGAQNGGDDERRNIHVFADVSDAQPWLVDVDPYVIHALQRRLRSWTFLRVRETPCARDRPIVWSVGWDDDLVVERIWVVCS
jgi:hypothetical protein